MGAMTETDRVLEAEAREIYETHRGVNSTLPPWEHLDPENSHEMGMKDMAYIKAREKRVLVSSLGV